MAVINEGEAFLAECSISGIKNIDMVVYYKVQWQKDNRTLAYFGVQDPDHFDDRLNTYMDNWAYWVKEEIIYKLMLFGKF